MVEEPIIRGIDAHKIYNSGAVTVHALRGVNLAIPRGEMVAIMGPSGCGKTTLLNCFSGLDDLTSGDVRSEEHTSELQSLTNLVCRLLLEKKKQIKQQK